ncbi:MAG TPA: hypothetical protein VHD81_05625 [Mycobacteriales bacterium]|nr:hypothetical protein [Mycobacteriales bacterium]
MRRLLAIAAIATASVALLPTSSATAATNGYVTQVKVGQHADFDRIVITFHGSVPNHDIRYVNAVHRDPSGKDVHLAGHAKLLITVHPTLGDRSQPQGTVKPHYPEIRVVKGAGNFEGYTSYGVGLAAHEPFHVSTLSSPNRLVIDIDHP